MRSLRTRVVLLILFDLACASSLMPKNDSTLAQQLHVYRPVEVEALADGPGGGEHLVGGESQIHESRPSSAARVSSIQAAVALAIFFPSYAMRWVGSTSSMRAKRPRRSWKTSSSTE